MNKLEENLFRVETTLSAINTGITAPWSEDHVLAHGLSGQRNKLGNALDHLLCHPNIQNANLIAFMLATELEKQMICKARDSVDIARDALAWWYDQKCPYCAGRGVTDFEQTMCNACSGTGQRERPQSKQVQDALGIINQAMQWMEMQQRKRLVGVPDRPQEATYRINYGGDGRAQPSIERGGVLPTEAPFIAELG